MEIPFWEKYVLSIDEASLYFHIIFGCFQGVFTTLYTVNISRRKAK